jgi:DNA-binding MarR family transcriptional regulator
VSGDLADISTAAPSRRPRREQLTVWRTFLRVHAEVTRRLEADLVAEHQLSLGSYDVLVQLVEAPGHRLRMTELAGAVLLSRSGLTRLVDRLERDGLVVREVCPSDARGLFAVMTEAGYARLRTAARTHLQGVNDYVIARLDPAELAMLGQLLGRLVEPPPELPEADQAEAPEPRVLEPSR